MAGTGLRRLVPTVGDRVPVPRVKRPDMRPSRLRPELVLTFTDAKPISPADWSQGRIIYRYK
jgi:hypothetical protein